jgi:short-subunit dehydrogenase
MPTFAVYAATKAYVLHLSEALSAELSPQGISCTAVCPGPVNTEFSAVAADQPTDAVAPRSYAADPADVVRLAIRDAERGRLRSVYGWPVRAWGVLSSIVPRRLVLAGAAAYKRRTRPDGATGNP